MENVNILKSNEEVIDECVIETETDETNNDETMENFTNISHEDKITNTPSTNNPPDSPQRKSLIEAFGHHLVYPEPITSKSKGKNKEKIPSAISSEAWRNYFIMKDKMKKEKIKKLKKGKKEKRGKANK